MQRIDIYAYSVAGSSPARGAKLEGANLLLNSFAQNLTIENMSLHWFLSIIWYVLHLFQVLMTLLIVNHALDGIGSHKFFFDTKNRGDNGTDSKSCNGISE